MNFLVFSSQIRVLTTANFHTSASSSAIANVMNKILRGAKKKKHKFNMMPIMPTPESLIKEADTSKKTSSKRTAVLNKLFMKHITDLMATGESAAQYSGLGIEINRVSVTPDYKLIQVFWVAMDKEKDDIIAELLTRSARDIRHELTQLRVIGVVPKIEFFKDKNALRILELEKRLEVADFGEDYLPPDPAERLKSKLELNLSLDPKIKEKILKIDSEILEEEKEIEDPVPMMRQDIFGLNHTVIMGRIMQSMKKRELKSDLPSDNTLPTTINENPVQFQDGMSQTEALQKFLLQREFLRKSARKQSKNYTVDREYDMEEMRERHRQKMSEMLIENDKYDEEDYIEEEYNDSDYYKR